MKKINDVKFDLLSDVHLDFTRDDSDFNYGFLFPNVGSKYLLVAGDICTELCNPTMNLPKKFFEEASKHYNKIVVVLGNHDYWTISNKYSNFYNMASKVKDLYSSEKIVFLDNSSICLDGVFICGGTLWTNVSSCRLVEKQMNDYRYIFADSSTYSSTSYKIGVNDTNDANKKCFDYIQDFVASHEKDRVIVLSHHCPSFKSCNTRLYGDSGINEAYCNKYDKFIEMNPNIKAWCHGHTHDPYDYTIRNTKILCNPCGYLYNLNSFSWNGQRGYDKNGIENWNLKTFVI